MLLDKTHGSSSSEDYERISISDRVFHIQKTTEFLEQQDFSNFKEVQSLKYC